jgi:hypothetical protein
MCASECANRSDVVRVEEKEEHVERRGRQAQAEARVHLKSGK